MGRIGLFSGGTGGHIAPAISVAEVLKDKGMGFGLYLGGLKVSFPTNIEHRTYQAGEISLSGSFKNLKGILQSFEWVLESDVILTFGGYPTIPPAMNSILNNKPLFLFECDSFPGKANRFFSPFSRKVFCAFRNAVRFFKNAEFVGIPIRKSLKVYEGKRCKELFGIDTKLPIVGFIGGSQGSEFLNSLAEYLSESGEFFVFCVSGKRGKEEHRENFKSVRFLEDISSFYSLVDVVISRAGMSTIGEMAFFEKPSVLIPYPHASSHQMFNALELFEFEACEVVIQEDFKFDDFLKKLLKVLNERDRYRKNLRKYFVPNASEILVDKLLEIP